MAELSWPSLSRPSATPTVMTGATPDLGGRSLHADPADTPMANDDTGDTFPTHRSMDATIDLRSTGIRSSHFGPASAFMPSSTHSPQPPWSYNTSSYELPISNHTGDRTVHTIYFKIWDPDSPQRSLYIQVNQHGYRREFDPEFFFYKLTGDRQLANQMSDYWRQHYGIPTVHPGSPFQVNVTPATSSQNPSSAAISSVASQLAIFFGEDTASTCFNIFDVHYAVDCHGNIGYIEYPCRTTSPRILILT